jgi:cytochrome c-type biogenesis protein CcmF
MAAMGLAVFSRWKKTDAALLRQKGVVPLLISLAGGLILPLFLAETLSWADYSIVAVITLFISLWVVTMTLDDLRQKLTRTNISSPAASAKGLIASAKGLAASYWGMLCAHIGVAICAIGVGLSSVYDVQKDVRMVPGDSVSVSGYSFRFDSLDAVQGPNFVASRAQISAYKNDRLVAVLHPEKRNYSARNQVMTEAALDPGLTRDLYVSLGEPLKGDAWAIRLHVKPFVRCIWLGGLMISLGGLLSVLDKRYRRRQKRAVKSQPQPVVVQ